MTDRVKLTELIRAEADACLQSSQGNGEYNTAFYVASCILNSLAKRLDDDGRSSLTEQQS